MKFDEEWCVRNVGSQLWSVCACDRAERMIVASEERLLLCRTDDGEILQSLKAHSGVAHCAWDNGSGNRFASGGNDCIVIIWNSEGEGLLRYKHSKAIQCLSFNAVTSQLASVTENDFGLWSPINQKVTKFPLSTKGCSVDWSSDGQYLAIGMADGTVSIHDSNGKEITAIANKTNKAVSCLVWCQPKGSDSEEYLAIGTDKKLCFYQRNGALLNDAIALEWEPLAMTVLCDQYLVICGPNGVLWTLTLTGIVLSQQQRCDWISSLTTVNRDSLICCTYRGTISKLKLSLKTVHSLYEYRYAYRENGNLTDVIVHNLINDAKVRIGTGGSVDKIAVFETRLAIQLRSQMLIYEATEESNNKIGYQLKAKIVKELNCNLLVVTHSRIVLCHESSLEARDFDGALCQQWKLESTIRYVKVIGGMACREGLILGLKNGAVYQIFLDNPLPSLLLRHSNPIRCIDLSANRSQIAIVDDQSKLYNFNINDTNSGVLVDTDVSSVSWHAHFEHMFAYTSRGSLFVKVADFPSIAHPTVGFVVGFRSSKVFTLHCDTINTTDIPLLNFIRKYASHRDFESAFELASIDASLSIWRFLATECIKHQRYDIASKVLRGLRDVTYTELLHTLQLSPSANRNGSALMAEMYAYQSKFDKAAKIYCECGSPQKAIEMYLDLGDWQSAKQIVEQCRDKAMNHNWSMTDLLTREAQWLRSQGDDQSLKSAADVYWTAHQYTESIDILIALGQTDVCRERILSLNAPLIKSTIFDEFAQRFRKLGDLNFVKQIYLKSGNYAAVMEILIENHEWDEAFRLMAEHKTIKKDILLPYAKWLAMNDRFDEASKAFSEARHPHQCRQLLYQLTENAIVQNKFSDAAYFFRLLGLEHIRLITSESWDALSTADKRHLTKFETCVEKSRVYHAYSYIYQFIHSPFISHSKQLLFNCSQFVLSIIDQKHIKGISKALVLYTLEKQCLQLGAYKLCRTVVSKLLTLRIPMQWRDTIEIDSLIVRTKPLSDSNANVNSSICSRCGTAQNLQMYSEQCSFCHQTYQRCLLSFSQLPLIEFKVDQSTTTTIADKDLFANIDTTNANEEILTFGDNDSASFENDIFRRELARFEHNVKSGDDGITIDGNALEQIPKEEIFTIDYGSYCKIMPRRYFRCMNSDITVVMCRNCFQFFDRRHFEMSIMNGNESCPLCRHSFK